MRDVESTHAGNVETMDYYVVNSLNIKGLLNLGVRSTDHVCCDQREEDIVAPFELHRDGVGRETWLEERKTCFWKVYKIKTVIIIHKK